MIVIKRTMLLQHTNVRFESDSLLLVRAFNENGKVSWIVRVRWNNCKKLAKQINAICTRILMEGNQVGDALVKNDLGLPSLHLNDGMILLYF